MLNSKEPILTAAQVSPSPILGLNSSSLKFICEICGLITENIDSLKGHLNSHNKQEHDRMTTENNNLENNSNQKEPNHQFSPKPVNSANSKINSIIANVKFTQMNSSTINIPQSMTVFNLKDISSKFKNIKSVHLNETPNKITSKTISTILLPKTSQNLATGSAILKVLNSDKNSTFKEENASNEAEKAQDCPSKFAEFQIDKIDNSIGKPKTY